MYISKRLSYIDTGSGILICWMIVYHIFQWAHLQHCNVYDHLMNWLCFFMPWFFFKSGMLSNNFNDIRKDTKKGLHKFVIPFFIYSFVGQAVSSIILINDASWSVRTLFAPFKTFLLQGSFPGNLPLWFLPVIFCSKLLCSVVKNDKLMIVIGVVLGGGYCGLNIDNLCYIITPFLGACFYSVGHILKESQFKKEFVVISCIIFAIIVLAKPSYVDFRTISVIKGSYLLWIISSVAGCVCFNNIVRFLDRNLHSVFIPFRYIGENATLFFSTHWIILTIGKYIWQKVDISDNMQIYFVYLIVLNVLLLPLLSASVKKLSSK